MIATCVAERWGRIRTTHALPRKQAIASDHVVIILRSFHVAPGGEGKVQFITLATSRLSHVEDRMTNDLQESECVILRGTSLRLTPST